MVEVTEAKKAARGRSLPITGIMSSLAAIINLTHHIIEGHTRPCALPETMEYVYGPSAQEGELMEFRLIYSGRLPAETDKPRPEAKHAIRKHFSPQILNLWSEHPLLSWRGGFGEAGTERAIIEMDEIANKFKQISRSNHIWKFLPLIRREDFVSCELDILFLRRGGPGGLIKRGSGGGDLDNRIKVLFDALRIPDASQEVDDREQQSDEDPLYCLLENDELIDRFRVTTDRLLTPLGTDHINDVHIVIHVKTQVLNFKRADVSLW